MGKWEGFDHNHIDSLSKEITITGYRYVVCLVDHHLEKLNVRIDGAQLMAQPDGFVEVEFEGLEVRGYEAQGKVQFTAKATSIYAV